VDLPDPVPPTSATVRPASTVSDTSWSIGDWAPSYANVTSRSSTRPPPAGRGRASAGATRRGSRSSTSNRRAPEAVARWASPSAMPSWRIGAISISRYA
jgi:hypothetical protein